MFQRISSSEDCIVFMFKAVTRLSRDGSPFSSCCLDWFSPLGGLQSWFKAPKLYPLNSEKEGEGGYHLVWRAWLWTALLLRETWNIIPLTTLHGIISIRYYVPLYNALIIRSVIAFHTQSLSEIALFLFRFPSWRIVSVIFRIKAQQS